MSDVSPDDLTARLDDLLLDIKSDMGRHLGIDGADDEGLDYLTDLVGAATPLLKREVDRLDALSADVARLTAEVAERDATIERLRDALVGAECALRDHPLQAFRTDSAARRRAEAIDRARAVLADTAPTPETKSINYDGPDPSVECAYPPCTNRLRRVMSGGAPQWCSKDHRSRSEGSR